LGLGFRGPNPNLDKPELFGCQKEKIIQSAKFKVQNSK
jgi:hypothetical protein